MSQKNNKLHIDWILVTLYFLMVVFGWFTIFAVTGPDTFTDIFNFGELYGKQLIFIGLSFFLIIFILSVDNLFFEQYSFIFYILFIIVLLGLFPFGKNVNGQTNWYSIGGYTFQPSEFVKITTALVVASLLGDNLFDLTKFKDLKNVLFIIFVPLIIIVIQKDVGSALVFFSFIFAMLRKGLPIRFFWSMLFIAFVFIFTLRFGISISLIFFYFMLATLFYYAIKRQPMFIRKNLPAILIAIIGLTFLIIGSKLAYEKLIEPHHRDRLQLWLRMENSPEKIKELKKTYGYNNDQSIQTISSGGFIGKGFLNGDRTNGKFVPAQQTDYIFSAVGEEFGFVGSAIVVFLFMSLILRLIYKSEIQKSKFARYYGYGVIGIFFAHFTINIGMVLDLLPTVGIPLPFFSYGGSSFFAFTILLFIFIRLDGSRLDDF